MLFVDDSLLVTTAPAGSVMRYFEHFPHESRVGRSFLDSEIFLFIGGPLFTV